MWRSTFFTLLTRTSVARKNPSVLVGCFRSSYLSRRIPSTFGFKYAKNESKVNPKVGEKIMKPAEQVLCRDIGETNVNKYVTLKGVLKSSEGQHWLIKDKSGMIPLVLSRSKTADLDNWVSKFQQGAAIELTGIVKRFKNNAVNEYYVLVVEVPSLQAPKVRKEKISFTDLNEKELSRILPVHMNWFFQRSHGFNELNERTVGQNVTLCGWVSWICDSDKTIFMLQDGNGQILVDCSNKAAEIDSQLQELELDYLILLEGKVVKRPIDEINYNLNSGTIKVCVKDIREMEKLDQEAVDLMNDIQSKAEDIEEERECESNPVEADHNIYTLRSHNCGEINDSLIDQPVRLMGWIIFSRMNRFLVLKDKYGAVQLCLKEKMFEELKLGLESVISVEGIVRARPENQKLYDMRGGCVEVHVKEVKVISRARELPFTLKSFNAKKFLLLQYRYLNLRMNSRLQDSLALRCQVLHKMRKFLIENIGFLEVETPVLSRRSPGGAQEFVVPTREKGKFYGLVQSPQMFKQLLMIGSVDRYFQIARCFRDETGRKDRQPEFTQLDLEMSFCDQEGVLNLVEDLLKFVWPSHLPALETPFPRLTYSEAIKLYGTDKPDLRHKIEAIDLAELLEDALFQKYVSLKLKDCNGLVVKGITLPMHKEIEEVVTDEIQSGVCTFKLRQVSEEEIEIALSDFCDVNTQGIIRSKMNFKPGSFFILVFGKENDVEDKLLRIQLIYSKVGGKLEESQGKNSFEFVWITDFPLFEINQDNNVQSVHHPFTQPVPEDMALLDENPLQVKGQHYDLVLNGNEIGGGSIRIHDVNLQRKILSKILKLDEEPFQHFLKALSFGAPSHGGFALGIDRFLAILCGAESIDDVMAFPKFNSGQDPLSGAPSEISDDDKNLYHLESESKPNKTESTNENET